MPQVTIQIVLENTLKCGTCDTIIVQTSTPEKLLINQGVAVEDIKTFFRANIVEFEEVSAGGCEVLYRYTISYDDALLIDVDDPILACDVIRIGCADYIIEFIDENNQNHTLSSPSQGIIRLTRPDVTFDDVPVTIFTNLPIQGDGSSGDPVDLLISADAGNSIVLGTDSGVYAPSDRDWETL